MNFYEKFKQETPQLSFKHEDVVEIEFYFDTYGRWDAGEEAVEEHIKDIQFAIECLKNDVKIAPELSYLVGFLTSYLDSDAPTEDYWKIEVDLNKLKYCKTLLCYIEEEYAENAIALLDYLNDELVDNMDFDEARVYFLTTSQGFCVVRKDILEKGLEVPLAEGDTHYGHDYPLQYRYEDDNEEKFQVLYNGNWLDAYSVDFDFPFEHLRVE